MVDLTLYSWAVNHCTSLGMPERQAEAVVQQLQLLLTTMEMRQWKHDYRDYPESFRQSLIPHINRTALQCIDGVDESCSTRSWYRDNFRRAVEGQ